MIVPYRPPESGNFNISVSSPQVFGTVAMSRQPDKYTCAETLVHETQHLKLCALLDLVTLTRPDDGQRYYAPWRPDPRPISGLFQGAYAFLGVSGFWREQRQAAPEAEVRQRAHAEFARWRDGAATAAATLLRSGQLTSAGETFVETMAEVLDEWRREPVPADALDDRATRVGPAPGPVAGRQRAGGLLGETQRTGSDRGRIEVRVESSAATRRHEVRRIYCVRVLQTAAASCPGALSRLPRHPLQSCPGRGSPHSRGCARGWDRAGGQP